ncbi:hypothetical protein AGDE_05564 [Angomonas deanei]|uniref:Uncharacterized protein n=1 Tax=Angomonas deanei TaxID=59799 RepID=A0A7G2CTH6_9TRYP|nr:hypothetical protein AGDE_05564 [Angomonas deanei]CAD2221743.1 hypothetical protein, conserved [Angomonas deanei]|eukprot:EPY38365.1 hypothetical protein AGDE_05564 [Angomonas deanei]
MRFFVLASILSTVCVTALTVQTTDERLPDGHYCGTYSFGLVKGEFNTTSGSTFFDLSLEAFGDTAECKNEKYIYDPATHKAVVVGATDPNDCLGKLLSDNKLTLEVLFNPEADIVTLDLGITKIDCPKCKDK